MGLYCLTVSVIQDGPTPIDAKEYLEMALGEIMDENDFEVHAVTLETDSQTAFQIAGED